MTRADLAPCPLCGAVVQGHEADKLGPVVWCSEPDCRYSTTTEAQHETVSRRAELGKLVEEIFGASDRFIYWTVGQDQHQFTVDRRAPRKAHHVGLAVIDATLLEALRALAVEVSQ